LDCFNPYRSNPNAFRYCSLGHGGRFQFLDPVSLATGEILRLIFIWL